MHICIYILPDKVDDTLIVCRSHFDLSMENAMSGHLRHFCIAPLHTRYFCSLLHCILHMRVKMYTEIENVIVVRTKACVADFFVFV